MSQGLNQSNCLFFLLFFFGLPHSESLASSSAASPISSGMDDVIRLQRIHVKFEGCLISDPCLIDHQDLKSMVLVSEGLFVFINCSTCLFAYWKTVGSVRASSAQSIRSNTLTCKELLHVADSKGSSARFIDPVCDLLLCSAMPCYYFFQIKHFLHAEIDFQ